jgi:hypothetical protein
MLPDGFETPRLILRPIEQGDAPSFLLVMRRIAKSPAP